MVIKISEAGEISVPEEIRDRWHTRELVAEDHGDHMVLRPSRKDVLDELQGIVASHPGPSSDELQRTWREEEAEAEERKFGQVPPGSRWDAS